MSHRIIAAPHVSNQFDSGNSEHQYGEDIAEPPEISNQRSPSDFQRPPTLLIGAVESRHSDTGHNLTAFADADYREVLDGNLIQPSYGFSPTHPKNKTSVFSFSGFKKLLKRRASDWGDSLVPENGYHKNSISQVESQSRDNFKQLSEDLTILKSCLNKSGFKLYEGYIRDKTPDAAQYIMDFAKFSIPRRVNPLKEEVEFCIIRLRNKDTYTNFAFRKKDKNAIEKYLKECSPFLLRQTYDVCKTQIAKIEENFNKDEAAVLAALTELKAALDGDSAALHQSSDLSGRGRQA